MRVWQAIGIGIIIVLVLMWVNARNDAIQLEQEREETWQIRRLQGQADHLYRLEQEQAWERDQRQLDEALRETRDNLRRDRRW